MDWFQRLKIDKFLLVMICVVVVASVFPCEGYVKTGFEYLTTAAIALLFFYARSQVIPECDSCRSRALALTFVGLSQHFCTVSHSRVGDVGTGAWHS